MLASKSAITQANRTYILNKSFVLQRHKLKSLNVANWLLRIYRLSYCNNLLSIIHLRRHWRAKTRLPVWVEGLYGFSQCTVNAQRQFVMR